MRDSFCRTKAVPTSALSLPAKIAIGSVIGLVVVAAIVGPAVYFGLAGKTCLQLATPCYMHLCKVRPIQSSSTIFFSFYSYLFE